MLMRVVCCFTIASKLRPSFSNFLLHNIFTCTPLIVSTSRQADEIWPHFKGLNYSSDVNYTIFLKNFPP